MNPFPCCEYDIAYFDAGPRNVRVVRLDDKTIELINFYSNKSDPISLYRMIPISYRNMPFLPGPYVNNNLMAGGVFMGESNKMLVNALFNIETASRHFNLRIDLSSLYLKAASYDLIVGILLRTGVKPMPSHELSQIRNLIHPSDQIKDCIESALECLGLERASKTSIARSYRALREIIKNRDDKNIIFSKIDYLMENGLGADCYYYIGKIGLRHLDSYARRMGEIYPKLINLTFDLNLDTGFLRKMSTTLIASCKKVLKIRL